jgi:SAM-dependent methyltransferase
MTMGVSARMLLAQLTRSSGFISNTIILLELAETLRTRVQDNGGSVLDLGAGTKPYHDLYSRYFATCLSVDVEHSPHDISEIDVVASADALPFEDATFDWVICTEVLEHCPRPGEVLLEVRRVLKPGGTCFLTTPFLHPLHELPYDFYRFTPPALRYLAETARLKVDSIKPRGEYWAVLLVTALFPISKFWRSLSKMLGVNLSHPANPLSFVTVALPQIAYLVLWYMLRGNWARGLRGLGCRVFGHHCLGFTTVIEA